MDVGGGECNPVEGGVHQNRSRRGCHVARNADVIRARIHRQDMAVAVEDAVVLLVFVMILQLCDGIRDRIDRMLQRVVRLDEMPLCIPQRDDGLTVVEAVAHHGVDDDRVGELWLLGHGEQAGEESGDEADEAFERVSEQHFERVFWD